MIGGEVFVTVGLISFEGEVFATGGLTSIGLFSGEFVSEWVFTFTESSFTFVFTVLLIFFVVAPGLSPV
ncbi:MAG: hypothetical protein WKG06_47080 [Segetibacter sp.]